jgi:hypothetical protein
MPKKCKCKCHLFRIYTYTQKKKRCKKYSFMLTWPHVNIFGQIRINELVFGTEMLWDASYVLCFFGFCFENHEQMHIFHNWELDIKNYTTKANLFASQLSTTSTSSKTHGKFINLTFFTSNYFFFKFFSCPWFFVNILGKVVSMRDFFLQIYTLYCTILINQARIIWQLYNVYILKGPIFSYHFLNIDLHTYLQGR